MLKEIKSKEKREVKNYRLKQREWKKKENDDRGRSLESERINMFQKEKKSKRNESERVNTAC